MRISSPRVDRQGDLAVAAHLHGVVLVVRRDQQPHFAVRIQHDGAAAQGMREHGHQRDGVEFGGENGAPCRQGVGGGAGGCRHYDAVRALAVHEAAVDVDLELDHVGDLARVKHRLVDREVARLALPVAIDGGLQQEAMLALEVTRAPAPGAADNPGARSVRSRGCPGSPRSPPHRTVTAPGRPQHVAVTADDDGEIRLLAELHQIHHVLPEQPPGYGPPGSPAARESHGWSGTDTGRSGSGGPS